MIKIPISTNGGHIITDFKELPETVDLDLIDAIYIGTVHSDEFDKGTARVLWDKYGRCNNIARTDLFIKIISQN